MCLCRYWTFIINNYCLNLFLLCKFHMNTTNCYMLKRKPKDLFLLQKNELVGTAATFLRTSLPHSLFVDSFSILKMIMCSICWQIFDSKRSETNRQTDVGNSRWKHQINFRSYLKVELILHPDKLRFNKICFWNFWQVRRTPKELFNLFCFWRNTNYNCSYYVLPT